MKTFEIDGQLYCLRSYDDQAVCNYIFNVLGGVSSRMTVGEYKVLKYMLNAGFTPLPSFYGRPTGEMYPQVMWYTYKGLLLDGQGNYSETIDLEVCYRVNYDEVDTIVVYEGENRSFKIGTFTNIQDVVRLFKLDQYIPVVACVTQPSIDLIVNRVEHEDIDYLEQAKGNTVEKPIVHSSFIGVFDGHVQCEWTYHIDYNKLVNVDSLRPASPHPVDVCE